MFKLLDAQSATSNGVWVEVPDGFVFRSFESTTLEEGASDATVDIMVSNDVAKPLDATDGPVTVALDNVGPTLAGAKTESYRWVKAKKTAGTTPVATTVIMVAQRTL
jgi:hypothetical protein